MQEIQYSHDISKRQSLLFRNLIYLILVLIVFSYFEFFKFKAIPNTIKYLASLVMLGVMLVFIILNILYSRGKPVKMNFSSILIILVLSAIPSIFVAYTYHGQSFVMSVFANSILLYYLLYFFVHFYKIPIKFILSLLIGIGLFAVLLYYAQYFTYPKMFLDITHMQGRGTVRLFVAGMLCTQLAYFFFLNRFLKNRTLLDIIIAMLCLSIFVLQGTRQHLFSLLFLTIVNIILARQVKSKMLILFFVFLGAVALFFVFREIINELTRVSTSQAQDLGGGIRIKAARFYLTTFQPGTMSYLFGNSAAAPGTKYTFNMAYYTMKYGFYVSDLGVLGDYIKYGVVFTITGLIFLARSILFKVGIEYSYLKYYIASQCFTLIAGYGILGGVDILIVLIVYIFDVDRSNRNRTNIQTGEITSG